MEFCPFNIGLWLKLGFVVRGGGGGPTRPGPFAMGDGPFDIRGPGGRKAWAGPPGTLCPPGCRLLALGSLGMPPANSPPIPPTMGGVGVPASSCDPRQELGSSLLVGRLL